MSIAPALDGLQAYVAAHERVATKLPGGAAWHAVRREALERLLRLGWPTARDESWKYVPLRLLEKRVFDAPTPEPVPIDATALALGALKLAGAQQLVFVNGNFAASLSSPLPGSGVEVTPLGLALEREPERIRARLPMPGDDADQRLALLNLAFLAAGAEIRIKAGASPAPLYLQFVSSGEHRACHPRVLIDLEAGARASVIEHYVTQGDAETFANSVTDIRLGTGAQLEHVVVTEPNARGFVLGSIDAQLGAESRLLLHRVLLSGLLSRSSLRAGLEGRGASIDANALLLADGREHLEAHSVIRHRTTDTRSVERLRGVAGGRARGVFNGRIVVEPGAARSESQQSSRALLLSEQAEIDSRPQLEILNNDVKCSHGATTGQLDPNMLFYLLSRGIDAQTARALLIYAFLDDVLVRLELKDLRQQLERRISTALPDKQRIEEFL
ncbi:MAG TPA: Fe-S cluster assembly protein SufD [Steroidobacteraceae bacterium]|nr:Fe-S cluster assembly protein SufD [Steroidobacteraceae bacterium]